MPGADEERLGEVTENHENFQGLIHLSTCKSEVGAHIKK